MWDYWLDEAPGECSADCGAECASPIHRTHAAYMAPTSGSGRQGKLDRTLVDMFEFRIGLDFALREAAGLVPGTSDEDHCLIKSSLQYLALDLHRFVDMYDGLLSQLKDAKVELSHLQPLSDEVRKLVLGMPDMRDRIASPGNGMVEVGQSPDSAMVASHGAERPYFACATMALALLDGLLHAMPESFCAALSKIPSEAPIGLSDWASLSSRIDAYVAQNPTHCADYDQMGDGAIHTASELIRIRCALYDALGRHRLQNEVQSMGNTLSPLWNRLERHKILNCVKQMVIELHILFDLHGRMRDASGASFPDDAITRDLTSHAGEISRLRDMAVRWSANANRESFSAALESALGYDGLLFLASVASEWVRVNANHYQEKCEGSALIPDLPDMVRRLDFVEAERDAALYRIKAHNALERLKVPAML